MLSSRSGAAVVQPPPQRAPRNLSRRAAAFWISAWWPVALGIAVIALESTEWLGANYTSGPFRWLFEHLFGRVPDARWNLIHHYIRKTGHFVGYGLIGLAWLRAWRMSLPRCRFFFDILFAILGTALIATCDEWHQAFLPNRTSSPRDVLLDCSGATVLCLLAYLFVKLFRPERLARA